MTDDHPSENNKILLFDHDKNWSDATRQVLRDRQFQVDSICKDFNECFLRAESNAYLAAIINVHAISSPLVALRQFHTRFPSIIIIILQDKPDPELVRNFRHLSSAEYIFFGNKEEHLVTEIGPLVEDALKLRTTFAKKIKVTWPANIEGLLSGVAQHRLVTESLKGKELSLKLVLNELEYIIFRMFSGLANDMSFTTEIKVDEFTEDIGYSGSCIFRLTPTILLSPAKTKSAVLKFGPKDLILQEADNYRDFVEWFLTVDQTVKCISVAAADKFAGILYSYPRDVSGGYISFAEYMRANQVEKCLQIIHNMFNVNNQHWHAFDAKRFFSQDEARFQTYYISHVLRDSPYTMKHTHFHRLVLEMSRIQRTSNMHFWDIGENQISFFPLNMTLPNPLNILKSPIIDEVKLTIIHGDLHAKNILIDAEDRFYLIDFSHTGFGDMYRDFIDLELSVRYELFSSPKIPHEKRLTSLKSDNVSLEGLKKLLRLEKCLLDSSVLCKSSQDPILIDDESIYKAFKMITSIRNFASQNCADKMRFYYLGLCVTSLLSLKQFFPADIKVYRFMIAAMYYDLYLKGKI